MHRMAGSIELRLKRNLTGEIIEHLHYDTNYHTPNNFKKINKITIDDSFSVLHVYIRSIQTNFEKLKDLLHQLKF